MTRDTHVVIAVVAAEACVPDAEPIAARGRVLGVGAKVAAVREVRVGGGGGGSSSSSSSSRSSSSSSGGGGGGGGGGLTCVVLCKSKAGTCDPASTSL